MRCLKIFWFCLLLAGGLTLPAQAQPTYIQFEFDGQTLEARPTRYFDGYVEVVPKGGGAARKIPWGHLSQATLKDLQKFKNFADYAKPFLDEKPQAPPPPAPSTKNLVINPVPRIERPTHGSLFASPVTWFVLFLFYLANVYAGYEIAMFRNRNKALVAGVCAIAPLIGPIIFVSMPTHIDPVVEEEPHPDTPPELIEIPPNAEEVAAAEAEAAAAASGAPAKPKHPVTVFQRGQFSFNRRFFETKMAGFLKVVPGEAEKDMVIAIASARGNYVGTRLARVSPDDLTLLVVKGAASQEVSIPFAEITEVKIRHQDAE